MGADSAAPATALQLSDIVLAYTYQLVHSSLILTASPELSNPQDIRIYQERSGRTSRRPRALHRGWSGFFEQVDGIGETLRRHRVSLGHPLSRPAGSGEALAQGCRPAGRQLGSLMLPSAS